MRPDAADFRADIYYLGAVAILADRLIEEISLLVTATLFLQISETAPLHTAARPR